MIGRKPRRGKRPTASALFDEPASRPAPRPLSTDPERLDVLVPLAPMRAWAAVVGLVVVAGTAGVYGWTARVNTTVNIPGVLLAGDGPSLVGAPADGSVARVLVSAGSRVAPGDAVAVLDDAAGAAIEVRATVEGTVASIAAAPGTAVRAGAPLVAIDRTGEPLTAVLFADPAAGATLTPGERVSVAGPAGLASGFISSVGRYPSGPSDVRTLFGTDAVPGAPTTQTRLITVAFPGIRALPGETYLPVTAVVTVASQRVVDALLPGGGS